ncbi:MAG: cytochrome b5 domain-containing protein, partial [Campylobacterota bacterium]|nr:cytochrome b5 domain-containing protein [Campylobacterota bacterium]
MTLEKLQHYNGQNGRKAYVAYKGKVYDVTGNRFWKNGIHKRIHKAGLDLTEAMENAPHAEEVFSGFSIVGILKESHPSKSYWIKWYGKYHPHPMLVHFPIALHLFSGGLDLLFFFQPEASYATAVFYTFFTATVMGGLAMIPGILSWWLNYDLAFTDIFVIKLLLSIITLLLGIVGIIIYLNDPDVVYLMNLPSMIYHGIILLTTLTVVIV